MYTLLSLLACLITERDRRELETVRRVRETILGDVVTRTEIHYRKQKILETRR